MLRKLLILGIFAGSSASVPILYQSNPDVFHRLLKQAVAEQPVPEEMAVPAKSLAPSEGTQVLPGRRVRLAADARGHFNGDFKVNGRKVEAMIDTGATLVALNLSTARQVGLAIRQEDFKYKVDTANGQTRAASVMIDSLQIGRIVVENVEAIILDDRALGSTLIGVNFLNRLGRYQVENGTLLMVQ